MTTAIRWALLVAGVVVLSGEPALGWGLRSHRAIAEAAIETLPEPLHAWLAANRERISDLAVEPDTILKERQGARERVRHFIDLDLYGPPPFDALPRAYPEAVRRYGRDTVQKRGTLPWVMRDRFSKLVTELRRGRWKPALVTAGHAAHYVADAFMPLHSTENHDGQLTGNDGIHRAVEHSLVDARLDRYGLARGDRRPAARRARFGIDDTFAIVIENHRHVAPLLTADTTARRAGRVGSPKWQEAMDRGARRLLTARLEVAVETLGSYWLSAWEEAGRPNPPNGGQNPKTEAGDVVDS